MSKNSLSVPSYCKHSATGQAVVRIGGKDVYLGKYGTQASKLHYANVLHKWFGGQSEPLSEGEGGIKVAEVMLQYWQHCQEYHRRPDGTPTNEQSIIKLALRPVREMYGQMPAAKFGPLQLKAVRHNMIERGLARSTINKHLGRIRQMFSWAVENELVRPEVLQGLKTVKGLRRGKSAAKETQPVQPVPQYLIDAIRPHVSAPVRALIDLQVLTGARPGELVIMRGQDLDISGEVWIYKPSTHKAAYHGYDRDVFLGPKAQEVIRPFLKSDPEAYLFAPQDARAERFRAMRAARKTKVQPSQVNRKKRKPKRIPGERYDVASYRRALDHAAIRAFPLPEHLGRQAGETYAAWRARLTPEAKVAIREWRRQHRFNPHRLRHNAGTAIRKEYGVEAARIILGHRHLRVTEVYAEANKDAAVEIMRERG